MKSHKPGELFEKYKMKKKDGHAPVSKAIQGQVKEKKHWIQDAIKKPGALRKSLGVKGDKKIPAKKLAAAAKKGGKLGARARLAETLKGFKHKKKRKEHSAEAISGLKKFVSEESKEKGMKKCKKHKKMHRC